MKQDAVNPIAQPAAMAAVPTPPSTSSDDHLPDDPETLKRMIRELLDLLKLEQHRAEGLQHRLDQLLRRLYGPKSEQFNPHQPTLFPLDHLAPEPEPVAAEPDAASALPPACNAAPKKKGHGRKPFPADLRRERLVHDLADAEKICPCCQSTRVLIGEEVSEQLDYQPANVFVWQHARLKYACPQCAAAAVTPLHRVEATPTDPSAGESTATADDPARLTTEPTQATDTRRAVDNASSPAPAPTPLQPTPIGSSVVVVAAKPAQPIDKGIPGPGLLAFVIVSKYYDHLPLYRQEAILARHGIELSRSTLCGWMAAAAQFLTLLYDAMLADTLLSRVIGIDETRLPVQEQGNDKTKSGRLWTFVGDRGHPHLLYHYTPTKARDGPAAILQSYKGFLQADAANVFDGFYRPGDIVEVGCWAHARRHFHDAKTSDAARAAEALARIGCFYDIEREAKKVVEEQSLDGQSADTLRLRLRQEQTLPNLLEFKSWIDAQDKLVLPKSPIAQAIRYAQNHWEALLRFSQHGFLNIDNNASERALRPAALGRKNWLFAGSDNGGRTAAILYSFTQTCRLHKIDPFTYLRDVLTRLPAGDYRTLADLFPHNWAQAQRQAAEPVV